MERGREEKRGNETRRDERRVEQRKREERKKRKFYFTSVNSNIVYLTH